MEDDGRWTLSWLRPRSSVLELDPRHSQVYASRRVAISVGPYFAIAESLGSLQPAAKSWVPGEYCEWASSSVRADWLRSACSICMFVPILRCKTNACAEEESISYLDPTWLLSGSSLVPAAVFDPASMRRQRPVVAQLWRPAVSYSVQIVTNMASLGKQDCGMPYRASRHRQKPFWPSWCVVIGQYDSKQQIDSVVCSSLMTSCIGGEQSRPARRFKVKRPAHRWCSSVGLGIIKTLVQEVCDQAWLPSSSRVWHAIK